MCNNHGQGEGELHGELEEQQHVWSRLRERKKEGIKSKPVDIFYQRRNINMCLHNLLRK